VWNLRTGAKVAVLAHGQDIEIREVLIHPFKPLVLVSGTDGVVKVYSQATKSS